MYASIRGVGKEEAEITGEERLKRVRLWHRKDGRVGAFSGGMRRRLSMVLSTIGDPKLVILDEVTTGLDPVSTSPSPRSPSTFVQEKTIYNRHPRLLEFH